jgi:cysteinyl-tRNA synthetase
VKFLLYNSLTRQKEEFNPIDGSKVNMYVCGITPYGDAHLGHARCYVVFDTLKRFLECIGYDVFYVQNITDIDDKIIKKSLEIGSSPKEIAEKYFNEFQGSMEKLNIRPADIYPKVTESIDDIISFVDGLIKNGKAYESKGSVYFSVAKFNNYGRLSGRDASELIIGQEANIDEKEDPRDFAVWKSDPDFGWDSPWGKGRPGWHIECSAMSKKLLGDEFDIHGGGLDLIFPHHENEVAQSEALTGKNPVRYWVHNGMVTLKGDKMAKSTGKFFLIRELLEEYPPMVLRMYLLSSSYRQVIDFSDEGLINTGKAYTKITEFKKEINKIDSSEIEEKDLCMEDEVILSLKDDLNTAKAIGEIFKKITPINEKIYNGTDTPEDINTGKRLISIFENVLGVKLHVENDVDKNKIELLIKEREKYRKQRNFAEADRIREELDSLGIDLKDTPTGTRWSKKT